MTYAPPSPLIDDNLNQQWQSYPWIGIEIGVLGASSLASTAFGAANAGVVSFVPFINRKPRLITKMFWMNGAAVAGNIDVGIYDQAGNLLVSAGTTAQAGVNAVQIANVTDYLLPRGIFYGAMVGSDSATATAVAGTAVAGIYQALGCLQQASVTLPLSSGANPATFAAYSRAFLPWFGIQTDRTYGP